MGVGVSLYFKWLKYIMIVFFIIALLSVPSMVFFIAASDGNFKVNPSFETLLALTTIGNLGTVSSSCSKGSDLTDQVSFFCPYGTLADIINFGTIDNGNPNSSCDSDGIYLEVSSSCNLDTLSTTTASDLQTYFDEQCFGKAVCTIDLSEISWDSVCDTADTVFVVAQCASERVLGETKEHLSYLVVIFDIFCIFFLWIMLQIHGYYEDLEEIEIEGAILDGSDFTVDVKNIPPHIDVRILKAQLWRHIEKILKDNPQFAVYDKDDANAYKIAQCNFALTKYTVMQYYKLRIYYEKQDRIINLKQMLLEKSDASEEKKEIKRKNLSRRRDNNKERYELNEERIRKCKNEEDIRAVKVFITMQSMEGKKRVKRAFRARSIRRCCGSKQYDDRMIQGKWLGVDDAPRASILLWENLPVSKTNRFFRIMIVSCVSALLMIVTFGILIATKYYQIQLDNSYNASTCPNEAPTQDQALEDETLGSGEKAGLMHCYCLDQFNSKGADVQDITFSDGGHYCNSWYTDYVTFIVLIYLLTMVMQYINVCIKVILRIISRYEKREDKTEEVLSNTFKMFVTQLINTVILLLIVNANLGFLPQWFPVLAGKFDDFTSNWYIEVGTTILLAMFFAIFAPHIANACFHLYFFCRRCCDRGCGFNSRNTKQVFQIDYEKLYIGPEYMLEYRYSQMLTVVFLTVLFGGGMPILYWLIVCTFFVTYWVDKFTLLRVYRTPPRYGKILMKTAREWINLAIFLHFGITFWMYSNSTLFETDKQDVFGFGTDDEAEQEKSEYSWIAIDNRINQYHSLIYLVSFGVFVACFIFKTIIFNLVIKKFIDLFKKNKDPDVKEYNLGDEEAYSNNFFKNLEPEHLKDIIIKTKIEKQVYEDLLKEDMTRPGYIDSEDDIKWYINRMSKMLQELEVIKEQNEEGKDDESNKVHKLYVQDHTYDIREIYPYNTFLADEDLLQRDKIDIHSAADNASDQNNELAELQQQLREQGEKLKAEELSARSDSIQELNQEPKTVE